MKYIILIIGILFCFNGISQSRKTKDGVSLGDRKDFISSCVNAANKSTMNIKGVEVDTYKYCTCAYDNLLPTLKFSDIKLAVDNKTLPELFLKDKNLDILMACVESNSTIHDDFKFEDNNTEIGQKIAIKLCVKEVMENPDTIWSLNMAEKYCSCAINKLYTGGFTYKDIQELENKNSPIFNEIAIPCITEAFKGQLKSSTNNNYYSNDIIGDTYSSNILLIDYLGQGYKIKISINGISKYYLFDTGASGFVIDRDFERELLLNGTLKKENYLGTTYYTLANNKQVKAQLVKISNIKVGGFIVNNVIASIIDEGTLLCGKGFLDKFRKWEFKKDEKTLILYK